MQRQLRRATKAGVSTLILAFAALAGGARANPAAVASASPVAMSASAVAVGAPPSAAGSSAAVASSASPPAAATEGNPHAGSPHAANPHGAQGNDPDAFLRSMSALVQPDAIVARVVDAQGKPLAGRSVELETTFNSVAQGTTRSRTSATTDTLGMVRFSKLATGSFYSYAVGTKQGDAVYTTETVQLDGRSGRFLMLPVFPSTDNPDDPELQVAAGATVVVDAQDTDFKVDVSLQIVNRSAKSWVPRGLTLALPAGALALEGGEPVGLHFAQRDGAVELVGTVAPGEHRLGYRFRVRNAGVDRVDLPIALPPIVVQADIYALAARGMKLAVPEAKQLEPVRDRNGVPYLHQRLSGRTFSQLSVSLIGLPVHGRGRLPATLLAILFVGAGLWTALATRHAGTMRRLNQDEYDQARELLLRELVELERAFRAKDVGPRTHAVERQRLMTALARLELRKPDSNVTVPLPNAATALPDDNVGKAPKKKRSRQRS